ncbi:hypothetical protein D3C86_1806370 [compost metagenome]
MFFISKKPSASVTALYFVPIIVTVATSTLFEASPVILPFNNEVFVDWAHVVCSDNTARSKRVMCFIIFSLD